MAAGRGGKRIVHAERPIVASPSGLPSQHLVAERDGASTLFVGQQWLQPGERVLRHTHPVEEVLTFLGGEGEATLGDETVPIAAGVSLYIPPGLVHGFRCTAGTLHLLVVFPVPRFAETRIVEESAATGQRPVVGGVVAGRDRRDRSARGCEPRADPRRPPARGRGPDAGPTVIPTEEE